MLHDESILIYTGRSSQDHKENKCSKKSLEKRERERERENYFFAIEQNKKSGGGGGGGGGHKICGEKLLYLLSQLVKSQAGGFLEAGGSDAWHPRIMGLVRTGSPT